MTSSLLIALGAAAQSPSLWRWVDRFGYLHYTPWVDVPERERERAVPAESPLPPGTSACEAAWHRYLASQACFDAYRLVGGGLKADAFRYCQEMPQPQPCK